MVMSAVLWSQSDTGRWTGGLRVTTGVSRNEGERMIRVLRGMAVVLALVPMSLAAPTLVEAQGIGVGMKAGFLHTSFDDATNSFDSGSGWQAGLWFGGNRPGTVGFMGEFNILAKQDDDSKIYYFQVPALLRLNFGSSSRGLNDAIVYIVGGPALDLKFDDDLAVTVDEVESVDVSVVVGVGFEISRFLVEGRYSQGFRNIAVRAGQPDVKSSTVAVLFGLRFN